MQEQNLELDNLAEQLQADAEAVSTKEVSDEDLYNAFVRAMRAVTGVPGYRPSKNMFKREIANPTRYTACEQCGNTKTTLYSKNKYGIRYVNKDGERVVFCSKHRPE